MSNNNKKPEFEKGLGKVIEKDITREMKQSYLDYAMSVIVSRALPDVRDGLKPVQRRILYAMKKMNLSYKSRYSKSAKVVGETMGKYHPHGDQAIYDALVRMAQDFSLRYPLVDGHGNFGSVDGDPAAAMRYTEVRMAKIAKELLKDINKNTIDFVDNFDGSIQEPAFLPAKIPNLLMMGADGIAVGMATKIPPHNLEEISDAVITMIDKGKAEVDKKVLKKDPEKIDPQKLTGKFTSETSIEDLLKHIKGPDFPTGAEIYNWKEIKKAYIEGKGKIVIRSKTNIKEGKRGKHKIVVNEIPYQVNKARLIRKIANLVKDKKIRGITNIRDESDRHGLQIVIALKRNSRPKAILNNLYKHTKLQTSFPSNMVALVNGVPQVVNLKTILTEFVKHRQLVIVKRNQFELISARKRAHILEGLKIALDNLDAVIETIKKSADADKAKKNLIKKFALTEIQAVAILDMQLRRLAALERKKIEDEYKEIKKKIKEIVHLLTHPQEVLETIVSEIKELKEKYGNKRKTKVYRRALEELETEDLIPNKPCFITITKSGYIKRLSTRTYKKQRRGGKGVKGMTTKEEDEIAQIKTASTHDRIFFFSDRGKVFSLKAYELPEGSRQSKGQAIINLINIKQSEKIQTVLVLPKNTEKKYLFMATKKGQVKKTAVSKFSNIRSNGLIAIRLKGNDKLIKVMPTTGKDLIMLITHNGKSIKFSEKQVRGMGRATSGMKGINLKGEDYLIAAESFLADPEKPDDKRRKFFRDLLVVTEKGLGKRTPVKDFPLQKRAGIGVKAIKITKKTGKMATALLVDQDIKEIIITSRSAQVIKLPIKNIRRSKRNTQGVILMRFARKDDSVADVTFLKK